MKVVRKWNEVARGSKITLVKNTVFNSFDGKQTLKPGIYTITGFWANVCGLKTTRDFEGNEFVIPSVQLTKFENIIK